ncbi:MAG: NADH-quinone oxidoreductase subunit M, partial [Methylobacter sp.]
MTDASFPVLSLAILLPLVGAIAIAVTRDIRSAKNIALVFAALELIATGSAAWLFNVNLGNSFQLVEHYAWIPSLNIEYLVGVDGISVLFLPMSALLTLMAIIASWNSVQHLTRFHFALLLALESITIGV